MQKVAVLKFGGHALIEKNSLDILIVNIKYLQKNNYKVVLVHGGTPSIQGKLDKDNIKSSFVDGYRITTKEIMNAVQEVVLGNESIDIVKKLNKNELHAVGVNGCDWNLIKCEKKEFNNGIDYGYVGNVVDINSELLNILINNNIIPVVSPIGCDENGECYNLNSDYLASKVANALNADLLVMITNVNGVFLDLSDESTKIPVLDKRTTEDLVNKNIILPVMATKVNACLEYVSKLNCPCYIISNNQIIDESLFKTSNFGTKIVNQKDDLSIRLACLEDIPNIIKITKKSFIKYQKNIDHITGSLKENYEDLVTELNEKTIFVVQKNDDIIGTLRLTINNNIARISRLCIDEDFQNLGIGSKLLSYAEKYAYDRGCNAMILTTLYDVEYLQKFYKKNGYIIKDVSNRRGYARALMIKNLGINIDIINSESFL